MKQVHKGVSYWTLDLDDELSNEIFEFVDKELTKVGVRAQNRFGVTIQIRE